MLKRSLEIREICVLPSIPEALETGSEGGKGLQECGARRQRAGRRWQRGLRRRNQAEIFTRGVGQIVGQYAAFLEASHRRPIGAANGFTKITLAG